MNPLPYLLLLALCWATPAQADPIAEYTVARAAGPIEIDGHLDEFAWEKAEQINGFERILNDYDQISRPTRAKMLWDDQQLYFAFVCQDPDMWTFLTEEDAAFWDEEVVEVFIDPDGDAKNYLELEINPENAKVDLVVRTLKPEWDSDFAWDIKGLQSAVAVYGTINDASDVDQGWTVEFAIPYSAMAGTITGGGAAPNVGDQWRLNLYRIERKAGRALRSRIVELEQGLAKGALLDSLKGQYNEETEYTAWSETYQRGFHDPSRFGFVKFEE
ncbi:MAG: carbohydrate-binding family 9-like protein [Candidatus Handelsmanbacteria bacterium]|nr:carbohydrate-binding family 9-like protein [Candidatus Handelsmanbacteria bacterium]